MSLLAEMSISLLVGLGSLLLGLIPEADKAQHARYRAEGKDCPQELLASQQAKQGVKWFFVVWGIAAAWLLLQDYFERSDVRELLDPSLVVCSLIFYLIILNWAFQWTQTLEWPTWRLPGEVLAVSGVVFLIIRAIDWTAHVAGARNLLIWTYFGLPVAGLFIGGIILCLLGMCVLGCILIGRHVWRRLRREKITNPDF